MTVSCGQCHGCRRKKREDWAIRATHESTMHPANCWITLTYAPEHMPMHGSLSRDDYKKFLQDTRNHFRPTRFKYMGVGEYGAESNRPHYHLILFGVDFPDMYYWRTSESGDPLYRSDTLEKIWTKGHAEIGAVEYHTAAYTAKYCEKRITGKGLDLIQPNGLRIYERISDLGIVEVMPEFNTASNKRGLGYTWFKKYWKSIFPCDFVVVSTRNGFKVKSPPDYYLNLLKEDHPEIYAKVKLARIEKGDEHALDSTEARLAVREGVADRKLKMFSQGKI